MYVCRKPGQTYPIQPPLCCRGSALRLRTARRFRPPTPCLVRPLRSRHKSRQLSVKVRSILTCIWSLRAYNSRRANLRIRVLSEVVCVSRSALHTYTRLTVRPCRYRGRVSIDKMRLHGKPLLSPSLGKVSTSVSPISSFAPLQKGPPTSCAAAYLPSAPSSETRSSSFPLLLPLSVHP